MGFCVLHWPHTICFLDFLPFFTLIVDFCFPYFFLIIFNSFGKRLCAKIGTVHLFLWQTNYIYNTGLTWCEPQELHMALTYSAPALVLF